MHKNTVMYRGAAYRLVQAAEPIFMNPLETEEFRAVRKRYTGLTEEQRAASKSQINNSAEIQSIEKQLVDLIEQQIQVQTLLDKKDSNTLKTEATDAIKLLDKIERLQKRYFELLNDFMYKAEQIAVKKKEGSAQKGSLISKIEDLLGMDCELIEDEPVTDGQLTQKHPAGAESPNATLYPVPLKPQHRANAERRNIAMEKDPIIPNDMVKHDQKTDTVETSGKGESTEDKGWQSTIEKNVEKIAQRGSEKTAMPTYLMYKGRRYAKVEK